MELAPGGGNSKPVASGSHTEPWLEPRQPGNRLLSNFLAIHRTWSEPQFHFPLPAPEARNTRGKETFAQKLSWPKPPAKSLCSGRTVWSCCYHPHPPIASGGGQNRGNLLGQAIGLPDSFWSLPEESSNKAAQRQDTGSFQPSLTAMLEACLWLDLLRSGPVWPDPLLQISAGTNPAKEVVKAPVLQGFPQPWPAWC